MSGAVKHRGAAPPAPSNEAPPDTSKMGTSNGNGTHYGSLSYPSEVSDDVNMNEVDGLVTLDVTLPNGQNTDISIDYNTPMLDLLVTLAGKSRLNPSGLSLQLISEDTGKPLAYKANQTIGALGGRVVQIVNKADSLGKDKHKSKKKQPFEMTHRFTLNLPRGQKAVSRVSPITRLGDMMTSVCKDKGLDPQKHMLQLPGQPGVAVDPAATVGQIGIFEMNLINLALQDRRNQALSMPDLSQVPPRDDKVPTYMPMAGETKKKKGFFSFLTRKDKKFRPNDALYNVETSSTTSHMMSAAQSRKVTYPQNVRRGSDAGHEYARPKSMFVAAPSDTEISKPPPKENIQSQVAAPARKKKRAPAPPVPENIPGKAQADQTVSANENIAPKPEPVQDIKLHKEPVSDTNRVPHSNQKDVNSSVTTSQSTSRAEMLSRLHSRNSSDSSGYHELTLSGCESPEASHGAVKSKISIDTTSIESADNANGDSGIHESPIRVSPIEEVLEKGDSVAIAGPSASAEAESTINTGTLPSKKRKKAPAPPPISTPGPEPSETQEVVKAEPHMNEVNTTKPDVVRKMEEVYIPEQDIVQKSKDEVESMQLPEAMVDMDKEEDVPEEDIMGDNDTGFDINDILSNVKFDEEAAPFKPITINNYVEERGAEEDSMMMVETSSIASENIDQIDVISKSERPCAFVPPPPPTEPPPPDEPDVDFEYLNNTTMPVFVDKGIGVNEDNTSLAASSTKTSPVIAHHRRMDSYSSVGSVDTIEGISLDFQMAIRMGQETLSPSLDDIEVSPDCYKTEMALFVERMSKMASENTQAESSPLNDSLSSGLSIPASDSNSDTGSVIRHLRNDSRDSRSGSDTGSPRNKDLNLKSVDENKQGFLSTLDQGDGFAVSEEITVPIETVPPPPEFGDEGEQNDNESSDEEIVETLEEIIIPMGPDGYDFSSAKKVSEITTVMMKENKTVEKSQDYGVFRAEPVSITPVAEVTAVKTVNEPISVSRTTETVSFIPVSTNNVRSHPLESAEKEEFVLTTEDLSSVTFLPPKPKILSSVKAQEPDSQLTPTTLIMSKSPHKVYPEEDQDKKDISMQNIQSRVSQLSFNPRPESETDSVLEEKPITLLNMPSTKISVEQEAPSNGLSYNARKDSFYSNSSDNSDIVNNANVNHKTISDNSDQDYTDSAVFISHSSPDAADYYEERPESRASATSFDLSDQQDMLQGQYSALQQQFAQWQDMLSTENTGEVPAEQLQHLSSQMAMQQEMMLQLQSTMEALKLQQPQLNGKNEHQASSIEMEQAAAAAGPSFGSSSPPPPPPPPPPNASTIGAGAVIKSEIKLKPVKASNPKPQPKFERQLDPREELMIAIRSFNGREKLRSVPAKETKWIHHLR